jgi:hypothetical protein
LRDLATRDIDFHAWSSAEVQFFARDRHAAEAELRERYGPSVRLDWWGPARFVETPQCFATWVSDACDLTVFYPLQREDRAGGCRATEYADRVVVYLSACTPQGVTGLRRGYVESHATVVRSAPVGEREVIDAATGEPRPRWAPDPAP